MHWGNGGITPYNMYDNWLDHTLVQGANTNGDFGRLNSASVQSMLATIAGDQPGSAQQVTDFQPLLKYVATNLPVIPTVFSAQWFEANAPTSPGGRPSPTPTRPASRRATTTAQAPAPTSTSSCTSSRSPDHLTA